MKRFAIATFACLTVAFSLAGCSDDDDGAAGGAGSTARTVRVEEIRNALRPIADAQCQWLFRCCNGDERADTLGVAANAGECTDRLLDVAVRSTIPYALPGAEGSPGASLLRELNRLSYGFDRGRIGVDANAVTACSARLTSAACNALPPKDHCQRKDPLPLDDACRIDKLLVGKQTLGGDCSPGSTDCAEGLECSSLLGQDGVCVKAAATGDACFSDNDCGDKLVCDPRSARCVQGADFNAACSYTDPERPRDGTVVERCRAELTCDTVSFKCVAQACSGGSYCSTDAGCPEGTKCVANRCGKLLKTAEPCSRGQDCESGVCRYIGGQSICTDPAPVGAICNSDPDCASGFCNGTCTATVPDGQPCPNGDRQCSSGRCRNVAAAFTCAPAVNVGTACNGDTDCSPVKKLYCVNNACAAAPLVDGAPCTSFEVCQSEQCTNGKCTPRSGAGADCGTAAFGPCDTPFYCDGPPGAAGKCVAKKTRGVRCQREDECWGSCRATFGVLRCSGEEQGRATCVGGG